MGKTISLNSRRFKVAKLTYDSSSFLWKSGKFILCLCIEKTQNFNFVWIPFQIFLFVISFNRVYFITKFDIFISMCYLIGFNFKQFPKNTSKFNKNYNIKKKLLADFFFFFFIKVLHKIALEYLTLVHAF